MTAPLIAVIAIGFVLGIMASLLLYFVNFPPKRTWAWRHARGYERIPHDGHDTAGERFGMSFAVASSSEECQGEQQRWSRSPRMRRRRRPDLTIDTEPGYLQPVIGLGIGVSQSPVGNSDAVIEESRALCDGRLHGPRLRDRASPSWKSWTAPLPNVRSFVANSGTGSLTGSIGTVHKVYHKKPTDLESQMYSSESPSPSSDDFDYKTVAHTLEGLLEKHDIGLLGKVRRFIESVAEKGAKAFHDEVGRNPEEGLLLPLREDEREAPLLREVRAQ